jgi:5-methylcytosine-specific restriction endonuclease McrA
VFRRKVFERDGWTCRLCSKPVERDAQVPAYLAPTLDHILPLALGGLHEYSNVQCAHFICNSRKGDSVAQLAWGA